MKMKAYQYSSFLKDNIISFLGFKQAAGIDVGNFRTVLASLDMFLQSSDNTELNNDLLQSWIYSLKKPETTITGYKEIINGFLKYLNAIGVSAPLFIIPRKGSSYIPHSFTDEEWSNLIYCADQYMAYTHRYDSKYQSASFCVLLRLLFGCGLRLGEALHLEISDIDWANQIILVKKAKNKKQRYVPMTDSMAQILQAYIIRSADNIQTQKFVFQSTKGHEPSPFSQDWAKARMNVILKAAGIEKRDIPESYRGICLHCLRHTFTIRSFQKQHRNGKTLEEAVPYISAYLGHSDITGTDKYLNACYDLYEDDHELFASYTKKHSIIPEVWDEDK